MILKTGKGVSFKVDDEDAEAVGRYIWHVTHHGYIGTNIKVDGRWRAVKLHRWLLGVADPNVFIDHINGDPKDNRRENLRPCTRLENAANQRPRPGATSVFKGVSKLADNRGRPWRASIQAKVIGHFSTEEEAARAYDTAARKTYGQFAYLNFPDIDKPVEGTRRLLGECLHCGTLFEARDARRLHCSKACATLRWQKEKRGFSIGVFG
ncbi:HNH endonuclease protein [Rhizobium phage RHph_N65]|nr:HNH endonuclease protein [Rhizobium phage RHph_N65]